MFKIKIALDVKDAKSSFHLRKYQKRSWKPYPAQEMPQSQKAGVWASTCGKQHKNLFYVLLCHSLFGDSQRQETQLDESLIQCGCSSALKLKACISVILSMARGRGERTAVAYKEKFRRLRLFN